MRFLKFRLLLRLLLKENGASFPGYSAVELSDGEMCLPLAWAGVGDVDVARAAARRT